MEQSSSEHSCYVVTLRGYKLPFVAYADTACAKSVTGRVNAEMLQEWCRSKSWPVKIVEDKEPFKFGPGKRIWSTSAILVVTKWGNQTVVVRFSIVDKEVPFLISKFVMKRLGSVIDMDENYILFKRLQCSKEAIHDLPSGHVGPELVREGVEPPASYQTALQLCETGEEVAVDDPELQQNLHPISFTHKAHATFIPEIEKSTAKRLKKKKKGRCSESPSEPDSPRSSFSGPELVDSSDSEAPNKEDGDSDDDDTESENPGTEEAAEENFDGSRKLIFCCRGCSEE